MGFNQISPLGGLIEDLWFIQLVWPWLMTLVLRKNGSKQHIIIYIDLAMAKSEALDNIYSLLKQNKNKIKSCDAKWWR